MICATAFWAQSHLVPHIIPQATQILPDDGPVLFLHRAVRQIDTSLPTWTELLPACMYLLHLPEEILLEIISFSKAEDALELVKVSPLPRTQLSLQRDQRG